MNYYYLPYEVNHFIEDIFFNKELLQIWNIAWIIIRILIIILIIILIAIIVHCLKRSNFISIIFAKNLKKSKKDFIIFENLKDKEWKQITKRLSSKEEHSYKLAIIEAENFLSTTLEKMIDPLSKNLKKEKEKIIKQYSIDTSFIKELNNLKKNISHDMNYVLDKKKTKEILSKCEKTLRILGILSKQEDSAGSGPASGV